jgi:autophagy-related protein 2
MKLRIDSFEESKDHRLASCVDLSLNDLFLAETISGDKPVKILGEWFNEVEHPRDTGDGILMMKMVSMHPVNQISADGKYMSDESRVAMELLPLRFFVYQTALRFIRDFFCGPSVEGDGESDDDAQEQDSNKSLLIQDNGNDEILVSPTFFHSFKIRPCKLKVDYRPERLDTAALRDGSYVELVNLLPLEEMILTLKPVEIRNLTGWSSVFGEIARRWIEDICATQMHKFLTKSRPFQPFSSVGAAGKDLVMIPLQEYKQDGNIIKGIRDSTSALAGTVAYEALNTSAKVTRYAANRLSGVSRGGKASDYTSASGESRIMVSLPSRPDEVPSSFVDVSGHAFDSLTAGLREANYKIVYIPYKEYRQKGASGAAKSVVKGIPVAVRAPLSGASEALSYTLLGVRNQLRPDMMKEEKANLRGLSSDF